MELLPTKLIEKDGEWYQVQKLPHKPNLDHIETVSGSVNGYYTYSELADTRKARPQQRRLFFALLSDIYTWSGMPTDFLKNLFYLQYESYTFGKQISLSDTTESSVSDANQLLDWSSTSCLNGTYRSKKAISYYHVSKSITCSSVVAIEFA